MHSTGLRWCWLCLGVISWWLASLASLAQAQAQTFPDRPVRMVVPFAAGGPVDVIGRIMSQELSKALKQQFVVDNRLGAGGTIAAEHVATAPADGHTLLFGSTSTLAVAPALYSKVAYHPVKSFVPVSAVSLETLALLVNPAVPASNVRELVAYLKANPGKMNFGTPGNGTQTHLVSEMFRQVAGVDTTHIPYKGGAPSVVAAMSGEVQYLFNPMSTSLSVFKSGKLRLIAVTGLQRDALAPAIPTIAESGYPGFEALFWIGIVAPAATPRAVVELLGNEAQKILRTPEMKEALAKLGSSPYITSSADFGKLIGSEFEKWSALAVKANIKPE